MKRRKNWRRKVKENWKIWLLSFFLALVLIGRGVSSLVRLAADPTTASSRARVETPAPTNR